MTLAQLEAEMALARKLTSLNVSCHAFEGLTTLDQRKAIVGRAITANNVQDVVFTVKDGRRITLAQQFQSAYGEPL